MTTPPQHPFLRAPTVPATRALIAIVLGAALAAGSCGGGGDADGGNPDRSSEPAPAPDTAAEAPAEPVEAPAGAPGETGAADAPGDPSAAWSTETRTREGIRPSAELVSARAAAHDGYDRIVLEFRDGLPGYTIGYVATGLQQCGSGRPVDLAAPYTLIVELSPAAAHDEQGNAAETRSLAPGLPVLRSARIICDFEGVVEWVVEAERRAPLRVLTLQDPARLVIDLRTTGAGD